MNVFKDLLNIKIKNDMGITGLTDEFFSLYLNTVFKNNNKNILVVVNSIYEANKLYKSLKNFNENVFLFPMDDFLTSEALAISPDLKLDRLDTINHIFNNDKVIVISNLMGYLRYLPSINNYNKYKINLSINSNIKPNDLVDLLNKSGYVKSTIVSNTGEFGVRGFIIDVFPLDCDYPIRIEFFDDYIESIRFFDYETQKSIKNVDNIVISPIWEFLSSADVPECDFGKQKMLPIYDNVCSIYDYLDSPLVVFKDYNQLKASYKNILNEVLNYRNHKDKDYSGNYMFSLDEINCKNRLYYLSIDNLVNSDISELINFNIKNISSFHENIDSINNYIIDNILVGKTIVVCLKKYQINSFLKFLKSDYVFSGFDCIYHNKVNIVESELSNGFIYKDFIFLSANELFDINVKSKKYVKKIKYSVHLKDVSKLSIGDYVVHEVHGIGIYNGVKTLTFGGVSKDYLEVFYQGKDKLYIPVEKIDLLYKYSGKEGLTPKINKLGSNEWEKTKNRVRSKVNDMADKLLNLYAERESKKGFAFSKDNYLMKNFENDFIYELTTDQVTAIKQIKDDMESSYPMDRLLCGDVGFGKTEVAFVAAFKAILDSKQVLFLCPTTILSNQHYNNALERFKNFPVSIGLLNRFTSKKETERIINGLKDGTIDLVFGTHRLLSKDILPKDLGLLIVDEEQRFGVSHKEKIKQFKSNIDVLTLTATPIPRTLQMSLTGIRSLSLIETPPINRYPVQTYVLEEDDLILRDAIYKELSRNGQVYILYNKVESIINEVEHINKIVPDARIVYAHGQLSKNELESKIMDFINHKYDILVCTTIIETGIDIPNVNTLIIMDSDRFGLSQLYQIRGRVGRSDKFAYAYLFYNKNKVLTESAVKRLNVIKQFTELGSGFSIATRDLSIRGAGDLLGSEQAGFIDSVGIDLYLKILNDEVNKRKNIATYEEDVDSVPLLNVDTHIDDSYIDDDELKIIIHRMINEIDSMEKLYDIKNEIEDRFGKINDNLLIYMYEELFEKLAVNLKISHVNENKNYIEMVFSSEMVSRMSVDDIFVESFKISKMFRFLSRGSNLVIILDKNKLEKHPVYYLVELLLYIYKNLK